MNLEIKFKCNGKRLLPRPKNALMHPPAVPPHPPVAGASIGVRCRYSTPLRATESWSLGKIRIISIYISRKFHRQIGLDPPPNSFQPAYGVRF